MEQLDEVCFVFTPLEVNMNTNTNKTLRKRLHAGSCLMNYQKHRFTEHTENHDAPVSSIFCIFKFCPGCLK